MNALRVECANPACLGVIITVNPADHDTPWSIADEVGWCIEGSTIACSTDCLAAALAAKPLLDRAAELEARIATLEAGRLTSVDVAGLDGFVRRAVADYFRARRDESPVVEVRVDVDGDGWTRITYPSGITTCSPPDLLSQRIHRLECRTDAVEDRLRALSPGFAETGGEDQLPGEHVMPVSGDLDDERSESLPKGRSPEVHDDGRSDVLERQAVDRQVESDCHQVEVVAHDASSRSDGVAASDGTREDDTGVGVSPGPGAGVAFICTDPSDCIRVATHYYVFAGAVDGRLHVVPLCDRHAEQAAHDPDEPVAVYPVTSLSVQFAPSSPAHIRSRP